MTDATIAPLPDPPAARRPGALPWLFIATGIVFVGTVAVTGSLPDPAWRWGVASIGLVGVVTTRLARLPLPFAVVFALAATRLATVQVLDDTHPGGGTAQMAWNLAMSVVMSLLVLIAFSYRNGRLGSRDLVDIVAVLLGTGTVAWITVAHPLLEQRDASAVFATLMAAYLPLASLLVVFTIDVAFAGLFHNRTMWFATAASTSHLIASWALALYVAGHLPAVAGELAIAGNVFALCSLAAAMAHADAPRSLRPVDPHHDGSDTVVRVAILAVSVIVPVSLVTVTSHDSATDLAVRVVGLGLLVVAVVVRLLIAARQNREVRDTLIQQVTRDDLTRLPNRSRFIDEVAEMLESTWHAAQRTTVVKLNLDRFKNINDSYGHYAANEVLVVVSERLRAVAASLDAVVARVGGDDFALVHGGAATPDEALAVAGEVRGALATPIEVGDATVFVTASLGVAIAPRNRTTAAEDLMRFADIAAHHAKQNGRNRIELFDESMQARLTRRMDVEHALHGAIGRQEMRLYHQPIVDIVTGRVSGFEALMRWERQDGTLVSPADFIPVAEETGLICELGAWALRDALGSLRRWIDDGLVPPSTTMSVNVSPRQVTDPALASIVRAAIAESGVPPELLWVEITESMMLDEPDLVARTLEEISSMGVRIAMDDFGTGFSSLSVLQKFPIHRIKIDRAFVQGLAVGINDRSLVRTIIAMARSMALDLVAEGVETIEQLQALRELGCDKAQGYLISRPVPADAMRSTMVALDEMASLSIFAPTLSEHMGSDHVGSDRPEPVGAGPVRAGTATETAIRHRSPVRVAVTTSVGSVSSRPIGGPML